MNALLVWLRPVFAALVLLVAQETSAQVIECPGALPAAQLEREQTLIVAERLFGRFSATLGLHGLDGFDERAIIDRYRPHPEQLLIKLTYLTLQCQLVLLDQTMVTAERQQAVRRAFLNYVLGAADPDAASLAAYVNAAATDGKPVDAHGISAEIGRIEDSLLRSPRRQWAERWFLELPPQKNGTKPRPWSVIVASPRFEDDGWQTLRDYQALHPDIHFELDGPFDLESPHYAIVVGRGLDQGPANQLLEQVKAKGLPIDAYIWRAPATPPASEGS